MTATIIEGKALQPQLASAALAAAAAAGTRPTVALVTVTGRDPMVEINRRLHLRTFASYGVLTVDVRLPEDASAEQLAAVVTEQSDDPDVHGVMVLMPLPEHLSLTAVLPLIDSVKELEGLHPEHTAALLASNGPRPDARLPLVGEAIVLALAELGITLDRQNIVILTQERLMASNAVAHTVIRAAAPAVLPLSSPAAIVPFEHPDARELARRADVLIVSLEEPELVTGDWVKPGATVIDFNPVLVGFQERTDGAPPVPVLRGGVDTPSVARVAGTLLPIPGGVGPLMLGILVRNAAMAASRLAAATV